jgi:hypothetical protein
MLMPRQKGSLPRSECEEQPGQEVRQGQHLQAPTAAKALANSPATSSPLQPSARSPTTPSFKTPTPRSRPPLLRIASSTSKIFRSSPTTQLAMSAPDALTLKVRVVKVRHASSIHWYPTIWNSQLTTIAGQGLGRKGP